MMPRRWMRRHGQPAGVMPNGIVTRVAVIALTGLVAALLLSSAFTDPDDVDAPAAAEEAPAEGLTARLRARLAEEQRRQALHQVLDERRGEAAPASAGDDGPAPVLPAPDVHSRAPDPAGPGAQGVRAVRPAWLGAALTDEEAALLESLYLERVERMRRSLRAPVLAQTNRPEAHRPEPPAAPAEEASDEEDEAVLRLLSAALGLEALDAGFPENAPLDAGEEPLASPPPVARLVAPETPSGWERLPEGTFLEGVLVNQLSGEFTGPALAQVAVPLYSADRQRVLVPRGTRAVGTATAVVHRDQNRLAVAFHRLQYPDGCTVALDFSGLNQSGESALRDQVDRHYVSTFGAAGAVGMLAGLALHGATPYAAGVGGFRAGAGHGFAQAATRILDRYLNRLPEVTVRAGHRVRIWLTNDLLVPRPGAAPAGNELEGRTSCSGES